MSVTRSTTPAVSEPVPVSGARMALILLLGINLFNYIDRQVLAAVVPKIQHDFHLNDYQAGWLATAFLLSYMVMSPLFGWLADRFSRWALVGIGVLIWSIASGASGLATGFVFLLITRLFVGIGEAAYGPIAPTALSDYYPLSSRGRILSWFYMAIPVGSAMGYVLGGAVAYAYTWHWAFFLVVPPGIALGIWSFFMKDPPRGQSDLPEGEVAKHRHARPSDYWILAKTPSYVLNTLAMAAMTFAIGGVAYWMPTYVLKYRHWGNISSVNLIFGAIAVIAGLSGTLAGGWAGDKLRPRFGGSYFLVSGAGMLAGFPLFLAVLFTPFPWAWVIIFVAVFCLFFNTGPSNTALANVAHPSMRATAFAINIFIIHALGDAISPPIIGWLSDRWGMNVGFATVSIMMLIGGLIWVCAAPFLAKDTAAAPHRLDAA